MSLSLGHDIFPSASANLTFASWWELSQYITEIYIENLRMEVALKSLCERHLVVSDYMTIESMDLQTRILEWVAFSFSRGPSQPRDRTKVSHIAGRFFTS